MTDRRRSRTLESLAAPGLRAGAMGKQLCILEFAAAAAAAADDRRSANRLGRRPCRRHRTRRRVRANPLARYLASEHRECRHLLARRCHSRWPSSACRSMPPARLQRRSSFPRMRPPANTRCWRRPAAGSAVRPSHVDANAGGVSLERNATCNGSCDPNGRRSTARSLIAARRDGTRDRRPLAARVRGDVPDSAPWATSPWFAGSVLTGTDGNATVDDSASERRVRLDLWRARRIGRRHCRDSRDRYQQPTPRSD